jgi:hypothetical protein
VIFLLVYHDLSRFLQGTWTAEVLVQGSAGGGNGFLVTAAPSPGSLVGRYYENVTDSVDVKGQLSFQVATLFYASPCLLVPCLQLLLRLTCQTRWPEMCNPSVARFYPLFLIVDA